MIAPSARSIDPERAQSIARSLAKAVSARRVYAAGHQRPAKALEHLVDGLRAHLARAEATRFALTVSGGMLMHEGVPLVTNRGLGHLVRLLDERECGGVVVRPGFDIQGVARLIEWLASRRPEPLEATLRAIEVLPVGAGEALGTAAETDPVDDLFPEFVLAHRVHTTAHAVLEHVMTDLRAGRPADFAEINELAAWTAEAACTEGTGLLAGTQTRHHLGLPYNDAVNVFLTATVLLQPLAKDRGALARIAQAALLHDVGKAKVPVDVLRKRGALDSREAAELELHPIYGAEILERSRQASALSIHVAYCHHMRDQGHGYPRAVLPIRTGPVADMVCVADLFEACSAEPVDENTSAADAVRAILGMPGMRPKRNALAVLFQQLTNSPPGSMVTLSSGESAVVLRTFFDRPDRPLVRLVADADGAPLKETRDLDLRAVPLPDNRITKIRLKPRIAEAVSAS